MLTFPQVSFNTPVGGYLKFTPGMFASRPQGEHTRSPRDFSLQGPILVSSVDSFASARGWEEKEEIISPRTTHFCDSTVRHAKILNLT